MNALTQDTRTILGTVIGATLLSLAVSLAIPATAVAQGTLENPQPNAFVSGVGVVSGWHCEAQRIDVIFDDGAPFEAAYGTSRVDTSVICGDANNGFGLLFNYNLLQDGEHTVRVLADGVQFGEAVFSVTTFGVEFLQGASGVYEIPNFPAPGENAELVWQQSAQNFMVSGMLYEIPSEPESILPRCADDAVAVGPTCVDKYEASAWAIPPEKTDLIDKVQQGTVTVEELNTGGATHFTFLTIPAAKELCPVNSEGCLDVYAVSVPGVTPTSNVNWFQAAALCRNAGKRLLQNDEWQMAAFGTLDGEPCVVNEAGFALKSTGTDGCVSDVGTFDMVGNASEWIADWMQGSSREWNTDLEILEEAFGEDAVSGVNQTAISPSGFPSALIRGGDLNDGAGAGVFALDARSAPTYTLPTLGFRCGR